MSRIIVAFTHNASREKITQLIVQCGYEPNGSFRSGAETLRAARKMDGGVVVCGYKLADMTADELIENLGSNTQVLVAASPAKLELIENPSARQIASPISRVEFRDTLRSMLDEDARQVRAHVPKRTPEEMALIDHAKALLIARGMTEAQAHSCLQQRSMRNRCKLTETAQQVIITYEINARS